MRTKTTPTRRELQASSQRQSSARQAARSMPARHPSGSPHEVATSASTEVRKRPTAKRTLWPLEARDAVRRIHNEQGSWAAAVEPFTELAKKKGWGSSYTVYTLQSGAAGTERQRAQWKSEMQKVALQLYEATGSWDRVVEPFNKIAAEKGWGTNYSKATIYIRAQKQLSDDASRESGGRESDSVDMTSSPHGKRKKRKTVVGNGDQDQNSESLAPRLLSTTPSDQRVRQAHQRSSEDIDSAALGGEDGNDACDNVEEDPILQFMICEYDRVSTIISGLEREITANQSKTEAILRTGDAAVSELQAELAQLKVSLAGEVKARNTVVARIVVQAKKHGRPGADARCSAFQVDIEDVQRASHSKCAQLGVWIRRKRSVVVGLKKNVHDMLQGSDWEDGEQWADVDQLGAMVAKEQKVVRHLEADRLREFVQLFKFSTQVREAATKVMNRTDNATAAK